MVRTTTLLRPIAAPLQRNAQLRHTYWWRYPTPTFDWHRLGLPVTGPARKGPGDRRREAGGPAPSGAVADSSSSAEKARADPSSRVSASGPCTLGDSQLRANLNFDLNFPV